jgi:cysteine desulfurase
VLPIYLDYNATTPLDPGVSALICRHLQETFGNPSSSHVFGKTAYQAIEAARQQVANLLGSQPEEVVFTSGGTEASNHAIKGIVFHQLQRWFGRWRGKPHIIISSIEHPATLEPCEFLRQFGVSVTKVPVDRQGLVDPADVRKAINRRTLLISIMHANNEVGTIQPIREISDLAYEKDIVVHADAAQSIGKIPVNVNDLGVDLLSVAGHKLYAPKGVGALFVRKGKKLASFIHGAGHEGGRRAGTENTPYLAGLGKACEIISQNLQGASTRLQALRDRLWSRLQAGLGDRVVLNGHPEKRLPNTLNANFVGHVGSELLEKVSEIAASTGSACHEGLISQSPVLCAMGVPPELGKGAVRLSVGRFTTEDEIDRSAEFLILAAGS